MGVLENAEKVAELLLKVQQHCMYAPGFQLDGVQAVYAQCGKAVALERMLNAMERHWLA